MPAPRTARAVRTARIVPAACLLVLLPLAGCGGDDKKDDAAGPTTTPTSAAPPTTLEFNFTSEGSEEFCQYIKTFTDKSRDAGPAATPAELEASFQESLEAINQAADVAQGRIKPFVETVATTFGEVTDVVRAANFEVDNITVEQMAPLTTQEFNKAVRAMQEYLTYVCKTE